MSANWKTSLNAVILFANGKEMTELDLELPAKTKSVDEWKDVKEHTIAKVEQSFLESGFKTASGRHKKNS